MFVYFTIKANGIRSGEGCMNDYNHCKACTWRRKFPKIQYNIAVCLLEYTGNETRTMTGIAVLKALLVKTPNNDWFQLSKTWDSGNNRKSYL